jgi:hypothetical protein
MSVNNSVCILFIARDVRPIVITWHLICCFLQEAGLHVKCFLTDCLLIFKSVKVIIPYNQHRQIINNNETVFIIWGHILCTHTQQSGHKTFKCRGKSLHKAS